MVSIDDRWVLLYSAGGYAGGGYSMGYAVCDGPAGPCAKPTSSPLMASGAGLAGPGGGSFFADGLDRTWIAYHAWDPAAVGYGAGGQRTLRIGPVTLVGDRLVVLGPSTTAMEMEADARIPATVPTAAVTDRAPPD